MFLRKNRKEKGSVVALMVLVSIIVTILGISMLAIGNQARVRAIRTNEQTAARVAADAGLTKAIYTFESLYESGSIDDDNLPSETAVSLPNFEGTFTYVTTKDSSNYTITSEGNFRNSQKTVSAVFALEGMTYDHAILTEGQITFYSSSTVDWYNEESGDTLKVGTNSTDSAAIWLKNNSYINGDLVVGTEGTPGVVIKNQGGEYSGDSYANSESVAIPSVAVPGYLSSSSSEGALNKNETITSSGKYSKIDLGNSEKLEIDGDVELYITGTIVLGNSAEIEILEDSSLTIYVDGDVEGKNGSRITNKNEDSKKFKLMGTDSCAQMVMKNSGNMYGVLYAPQADLILDNSATFWGAVVAETCEMKNSATLYYDASLQNYSEPSLTTLKLKSWSE